MMQQYQFGGGGLVTKWCQTLAAPWTVAHQDPLSMGFSRQETGVGCHFLLQGIFPIHELNLGLLQGFLMSQLVKNPPAMQETPVRFLGREDPLEKG